jgi:hypothetical protein
MWRVAILLVAVGAVALAGCGSLDRDAVQTDVEGVVSAAAEGALLAEQAQRGSTVDSFVIAHSAELHRVAQNLGDDLGTEQVDPGLERPARQAAVLARAAQSELEKLHESPADRRLASLRRSRLEAIARRAQKIDQGL